MSDGITKAGSPAKKLDIKSLLTFDRLFFAAAVCACGLFHEYLSALCSVALCAALVCRMRRQGRLVFHLHPVNVLLAAFPFFYLLTSLWAADRGMALLGFVKFFPVTLFTLYIGDREESRGRLPELLPALGALQTAVGAVLMQFDSLSDLFSVAGRLSGFFQYANTFAAFLLMGVLTLLTREKLGPAQYVCLAVLVFGILYSGSRTTAVLAVVFSVAALVTGRAKKVRRIALMCMALVLAAGVVLALTGAGDGVFARLTRMSLSESTFLGRLLYWKDALRLFQAHPFGVGYLGWSFMQFMNQTGVYTVQFVHNEYVQVLVDTGFLGFAAFACMLGWGFLSKGTDRRRRLMLLALGGHLFMDFDLQFVAVFLLLALLLYVPGGKTAALEKRSAAAGLCAALSALTAFSLWPGLSHGLYHFKRYAAAAAVYPANTMAQTIELQRQGVNRLAAEKAARLAGQNPYIAYLYAVQAAYAFSEGDMEQTAFFKEKQLAAAPYDIEAYNDYCAKLAVGYGLFVRDGDAAGAAWCAKKMLTVPEKLEALREKTDPIAFRINDRPVFELNGESLQYIEKMREVVAP